MGRNKSPESSEPPAAKTKPQKAAGHGPMEQRYMEVEAKLEGRLQD